ncbi:MAG: hypothetical protein KY460_01495 [Actinobacteria bacterium]|nr:hypothetical protein [Actinomycetota bacterium]
MVDEQRALTEAVRTGTRIGSGLGTSEPSRFYAGLWDHIRSADLHDIEIRQALFMAPHPLLVGDAIAAAQAAADADDDPEGLTERATHAIESRLDDAARLRHLRDHVEALQARGIRFVSAFMGPATNRIVPATATTRLLAPDLAGRNLATAGIMSWQPVHFPDAVALGHEPGSDAPAADLFVYVVTPPNPDDRVSFGASNGADGDIVGRVLDRHDMTLLLYVNARNPWIDGFEFAPNDFDLHRLEPLARQDRMWLVVDDSDLPGLPPGTFSSASDVEQRIARHVADHIGNNLDHTAERALQIGIGGTGAQIAHRLPDTGWRGRLYTEMLDPVMLDLLDAGVVAGSHIVHHGVRDDLDDVVVATFAMGA